MGSFWSCSRVVLGSSWSRPEVVLGSFWGCPEIVLESSWGRPGVVLESFSSRSGGVLEHFESVLVRPGSVLDHFWLKQKSDARAIFFLGASKPNRARRNQNCARNTQIARATLKSYVRVRAMSQPWGRRMHVALRAPSRVPPFGARNQVRAPSVYESELPPHPFILFYEKPRDPL